MSKEKTTPAADAAPAPAPAPATEVQAQAWATLLEEIQKPAEIDSALLARKDALETRLQALAAETAKVKQELTPVMAEIRAAERAANQAQNLLAKLAQGFGVDPTALGLPAPAPAKVRTGGKSSGLRLRVNGRLYDGVSDTPSTVLAHVSQYCAGRNTGGRLSMDELYALIPGGLDAYARGGWAVTLRREYPAGHPRAGQAEDVLIEGVMTQEVE